jgi:glycosyltransferase involved in cell wall biosynthesis
MQYIPWLFKSVKTPENVDVILANSWNAFAFYRSGIPLVVVEHHCVFDSAYIPYRNRYQFLFHETLLKYFETETLHRADALVTVSQYTAKSISKSLGGPLPTVIYNGVDTNFFNPSKDSKYIQKREKIQLLYVGNLIYRKGADLLPKIMAQLGNNYELKFTQGLRTKNRYEKITNMIPLGRLTLEELRNAYQKADLLLFPSRFEGFGYAPVEAMACGTPVVTTNVSSLPEVVIDGLTGKLCPIDDIDAFVQAVRDLTNDKKKLFEMGRSARRHVVNNFSLEPMAAAYIDLFEALIAK